MPTPTYTLRNLGSLDAGTTGDDLYGGLFIDGAGNLVGATDEGGANNYGTVFEIANSGTAGAPAYTTAPAVVAPLDSTSGGEPYHPSSVVADAQGNLYEETFYGGQYNYGTVIEIKNTGSVAAPSYSATPVVLASFDDQTTGGNGAGGLSIDGAGNLIGTTYVGGANNEGTVFELANTGTLAAPAYAKGASTLVSFDGTNGQYPEFTGRLVADAAGNLIGTAEDGGPNNDGTVFEIANTGTKSAPVYATTATPLASFAGTGATTGPDGSGPYGSVVIDGAGNLYGTTYEGGANNEGTVYEIRNTGTASAPAYADGATTLASFNGANGEYSTSALLIDKAGNLYGTTYEGGANGDGTVFELANTGTLAAPSYAAAPTVLASFDGTNGDGSYADLTVDSAGNLYGTTASGGANDDGNVFELVAAPAPTITGTTASNPTTSEQPVSPFSTAVLTDPTAGATDTLTITLSGGGGTLSDGPGFQGTSSLASTSANTYTLKGSAQDITNELQSLRFTPTGGAPGTVSTTRFTLSDMTTANGFVVPTDSTTTVTDTDPAPTPTPPTPTPTPTPAPDAVSISSQVGYADGVFTLSGTASSAAGVSSVEISATLGNGTVKDLGAATVNPDGTFTFEDKIGRRAQTFITAAETDAAGGTATGGAAFSLAGYPGPNGSTAEQDTYNADGTTLLSTTRFMPDGERTTNVLAPDQSLNANYTDTFNNGYQGGNTFVYDAGHGSNVVDHFVLKGAQHDTLSLAGADFGNSIADVLAHTFQDKAGDAVIVDPAVKGDSVTLVGVTKQYLANNQGDIAFHA